jgi:DNA helicase-2/ATP-dependent DNA helicase PcrA
MDENGLKGLEEERRLAYVGLTRARKRAFVYFAANRRVHGNWQSSLPSRFITELPQEHTDTVVDEGFYGGYVGFRDNAQAATFGSGYDSPGWKRAQANRAAAGAQRTRPPMIEAQAYTVQTSDPSATQYARGDRVFHQKFGYGRVTNVEGNKLAVTFDHSGEKKVIDTFVTRG